MLTICSGHLPQLCKFTHQVQDVQSNRGGGGGECSEKGVYTKPGSKGKLMWARCNIPSTQC